MIVFLKDEYAQEYGLKSVRGTARQICDFFADCPMQPWQEIAKDFVIEITCRCDDCVMGD